MEFAAFLVTVIIFTGIIIHLGLQLEKSQRRELIYKKALSLVRPQIPNGGYDDFLKDPRTLRVYRIDTDGQDVVFEKKPSGPWIEIIKTKR